MPDLADEGDITALAFPHLQFSIWVSPRCGIEPTPSLQRKLVACSVFNHWATSPLKTFFRFKHASSSDTFNNRVDVRQINKLVPYWISLPSSLCKIPINSSGWDDSAYLEQCELGIEKYGKNTTSRFNFASAKEKVNNCFPFQRSINTGASNVKRILGS